MVNIDKLFTTVKKVNRKKYKILKYLFSVITDSKRPHFFKYGYKFKSLSLREVAEALSCDKAYVCRIFRSLAEEGMVVYSFINKDGDRKHIHERMRIAFTPKGASIFNKEFKREKNVNDRKVSTVQKEDYLNKLTSGELKFKKGNEKRGAVIYRLLIADKINVDVCKESFRRIGKLCSVLAPNMSVEIARERVQEYVYFLEKVLHRTPTFEEVTSIKSMWKFFWNQKWKWTARERAEREQERIAERRLIENRKREYRTTPYSKSGDSIGNILRSIMQEISPPRLAVSMRMQT